MGAQLDYEIIENVENVKDLTRSYSDLVSERQWSYGHAGYSGTLAEKPVLKIIDGWWEKQEALEYISNHNDKWGPSFAFHLKEGGWLVGGFCSS